MKKSLSGMTVLITRPMGQAEELIQLIEVAGGKAYHCPVMAIEALEEREHTALIQNNKQKVLKLDNYQHVIVISTNAARYGMELINQYWPQLPVGLNWFAIGKTTASVLERDNVLAVRSAPDGRGEASKNTAINSAISVLDDAMNSEALLRHQELQQLTHKKVLIIRGVGGRDFLRQQLTLRGAAVDYLECYERKIDRRSAARLDELISNKVINTICLNSAESIDYFSDLLGDELLDFAAKLPIIVPSQRVADHAGKKGYGHAIVAENASNKSVIATLNIIAANMAQ